MSELTERITSQDYYPGLWRTEISDDPQFVATVRSSVVLQQEGLANDLAYFVNRHRKGQGYSVTDNITLYLGVSEEVWWALHYNYEEFTENVKATSVFCNTAPLTEMEQSWEKVFVGDKASGTSPVYVSSTI